MTFGDAIKTVYSKYFTFSGRAPRSEFWWYMLFYLGVGILLDLIVPTLGNAWTLGNFIPQIAVTARRLHDIDRSGWWQLLPVIALPFLGYGFYNAFSGSFGGASPFDWLISPVMIIGLILMLGAYILLIVWYATKGTEGPNRFGDDPFGNSDAAVFE